MSRHMNYSDGLLHSYIYVRGRRRKKYYICGREGRTVAVAAARVGPNPKSCFEWPKTNVMGAGGHPEHFEPKQRSVAAIAFNRTASKVLASQY